MTRMEQIGFWEVDIPRKVVNVASVPQRSPFRYPGGKTWLIPRIRQWLGSQFPKPQFFIEPFAGGAITGLTVAFENMAKHVILVEKDEQVAAVWDTIINIEGGAEWLANEIINFNLNLDTARDLMSSHSTSTRKIALKTIIQNRISHGGILADGAGLLKNGENGKGILSRWYPETLKRRILDISAKREHIKFIQGDGFLTIKKYLYNPNIVFFIDPPYTAHGKKAGKRLYMHNAIDHEKLFSLVESLEGPFLMTYDNAEGVREMASRHGFKVKTVTMSNTHHNKMEELLISRDLDWVK